MALPVRCSVAAVLVLSSSLWPAACLERTERGRLADTRSLVQEKAPHLEAPAKDHEPNPSAIHGKWAVHARRTTVPKRALLLREKLDWPSLGEAWQDIKDAVSEVTDQVGNIIGNSSNVTQAANDARKALAERLAGGLTKALGIVNQTADALLKEAVKDKMLMMTTFNDSITWADGTLLPAFEEKCDRVLGKAFTAWKTIQDVGKSAVSMIASGLSAAGQGELAGGLENATEEALQKAAAFKTGLEEARGELKVFSEASLDDLRAKLWAMNDRLSQGVEQTTEFVEAFEKAFQDVTDAMSDALGGSPSDMADAFASVRGMVASIAQRARGASTELAQGVHEGIVAVAREKHFDPPALATHSSASGRWTGASFLAAALSAAAALAL